MLELVVATTLIAGTLVPALRLMRDSMSVSSGLEVRELLTTFCVSKLEEHLAIVAATWQAGTATGTFTAEGYPQLRFEVTRSDAVASGGIVNTLMAISCTVWHDQNGDGLRGSSEPKVNLSSKLAKMAVYQYEAVS